MKTFEDLEFKDHLLSPEPFFTNHKQATMDFDNGYSISVLFGNRFYSNGIDTYEVAFFYKGDFGHDEDIISDNPLGYINAFEVNEVMCKIQNIKP